MTTENNKHWGRLNEDFMWMMTVPVVRRNILIMQISNISFQRETCSVMFVRTWMAGDVIDVVGFSPSKVDMSFIWSLMRDNTCTLVIKFMSWLLVHKRQTVQSAGAAECTDFNECPGYNIKPFDDETPALEIREMWSNPVYCHCSTLTWNGSYLWVK